MARFGQTSIQQGCPLIVEHPSTKAPLPGRFPVAAHRVGQLAHIDPVQIVRMQQQLAAKMNDMGTALTL